MQKTIKTGRSILGRTFLPMGILLMLMMVSTKSFPQQAGKWGWIEITNFADTESWTSWSDWQSPTCFPKLQIRTRSRLYDNVDGRYIHYNSTYHITEIEVRNGYPRGVSSWTLGRCTSCDVPPTNQWHKVRSVSMPSGRIPSGTSVGGIEGGIDFAVRAKFLPFRLLLFFYNVKFEDSDEYVACGDDPSGGDESAGNKDGNWGWVRAVSPGRYTDKKVSLSNWEKNVWSVDGEWKSLPCYKGIDVRVRRSKSNKTSLILDEVYLWQVVFRNRYSRKVVFSYSITDLRPTSASDGDEDSSSGGRGYETKTLYSKEYGELDDFYYDYYARHNTYTTDEESIYILIKDLRFDSSSVYYYGADGSEYGEGEYEPCDR